MPHASPRIHVRCTTVPSNPQDRSTGCSSARQAARLRFEPRNREKRGQSPHRRAGVPTHGFLQRATILGHQPKQFDWRSVAPALTATRSPATAAVARPTGPAVSVAVASGMHVARPSRTDACGLLLPLRPASEPPRWSCQGLAACSEALAAGQSPDCPSVPWPLERPPGKQCRTASSAREDRTLSASRPLDSGPDHRKPVEPAPENVVAPPRRTYASKAEHVPASANGSPRPTLRKRAAVMPTDPLATVSSPSWSPRGVRSSVTGARSLRANPALSSCAH